MPEQAHTDSVVAALDHSSYNPAHFAQLASIERNHFWFRHRNHVIATAVAQSVASLPHGYRVLEVGCGTGNVLKTLSTTCSRGTVIGMDLYREGLEFARGNSGCPLLQADLEASPFVEAFDVVGAFDVIEHLPDDRAVLRCLRSMLKPGGTLILTVPAHAVLWSYFDEASHHCRRYEVPELEGKLRESGYELSYVSEFMASLFPLMWVGRRLAALFHSGSRCNPGQCYEMAHRELRIVPVVNEVLYFLLSQERRLAARRRRWPFGTSILAIAKKN